MSDNPIDRELMEREKSALEAEHARKIKMLESEVNSVRKAAEEKQLHAGMHIHMYVCMYVCMCIRF